MKRFRSVCKSFDKGRYSRKISLVLEGEKREKNSEAERFRKKKRVKTTVCLFKVMRFDRKTTKVSLKISPNEKSDRRNSSKEKFKAKEIEPDSTIQIQKSKDTSF